jgi:hypothetical protein
MNKVFLFFAILAVSLSSCYYDSEEDLYPSTACSTENVSYTNDVQPILINSCLSCHNNTDRQGNITLETHEDVVIYVNNGSFLGSIKHASGYKAMPQNATKLDDCRIAKVEAWITAGALNN